MILEVLHYPNPRLKEKAQKVSTITSEIRALAQNMLDTMYHNRGIGLAATQVGSPWRVIVMDLDVTEAMEPVTPKVYINPEILSFSEEKSIMEEGCLSVVDEADQTYVSGPVERPTHVRIKYQDLEGVYHEEDASEMLARCMQHEIDHLDGILFIDRLPQEKKERVLHELHLQGNNCP